MDLRRYLRILTRRWRAIIAATLVGTALGMLATFVTEPQFRADSTLFVSLQAGADTTDLNQGNSFAQARVRSYASLAASPQVTEAVVNALGLTMTPAELAKHITAAAQPDTVLLRLTVTDTSPERAARICNAAATRFAALVMQLERPATSERSPVQLSVTEPATAPSEPFSPRPGLNLALGLLAGLGVGAGLAVARESLDSSVHSTRTLSEALAETDQVPVLCAVAHDPHAARQPLALRHDIHGRRAEDFRLLRTNLKFVDVDRPPRVIAVTSALPAEGKSTVAANLAATLAETGASVCLVDADLRRPSLARILGLVRDAGLTTVLIGQAEVRQVLQSAGSFSVLSSGAVPPNPAELLSTAKLRSVLNSLTEMFDHVVVDTSPTLLVADTSVIAPVVDGFLLVVRAARTSRGQIADTVRSLQRAGTPVLGAILNMASLKGENSTYGIAYEYRPTPHRTSRLLDALVRLRNGLHMPRFPVPAATTPAETVPQPAVTPSQDRRSCTPRLEKH